MRLNLSILDGWWAEAYDGKNGFAIGKGTTHVSDEIGDRRDADDLFRVLETEVVPLVLRSRQRRPAAALDPEDGQLDQHAWPGGSAPIAWWPTTSALAMFRQRVD